LAQKTRGNLRKALTTPQAMLDAIRKFVRALFPRKFWAKLRSVWCEHKVRRVEEICLQEMAATALLPVKQPIAFSATKGAPLRRMVLIADVMWETNELVPELERICEVMVHDVRPVLGKIPPADAPLRIAASVGEFLADSGAKEPDAILIYLRGNLLSEELFDLIRKRWSCPLLGMNLDDKVSFWDYGCAGGHDLYQKWAACFDLNLTNSRIASTWYDQAGAACIYLPPAMKRPAGLSEPDQASFRHALSFVGSPKLDREIVIRRIRDLGLPVSVFGKGWQGGQWVTDPVEVYRSSQINLGLGMATPNFSTTKNRDFECPGAGACYLTTFNWELAEWWDIGREILCYRNVEELIEIACWYRQRPDACHQIARAAWRRGMAEHTWELRFRKLFREMGFAV